MPMNYAIYFGELHVYFISFLYWIITKTSPTSHSIEQYQHIFLLNRCHSSFVTYDNVEINSLEHTIIKNITKLWANFAYHG